MSINLAEAKVEDPESKYKVDFYNVCCTCDECIPQIKFLKDFDEFLLSKAAVVDGLFPVFCTSLEKQTRLPVEDFLFDAKKSIRETYEEMKKVKDAFCMTMIKGRSLPNKGHWKTRSSTTLDLLNDKAAAFYDEWEKRFAPFFPSPAPQPRENEEETSMPTTKDEDLLEQWSLELYSCNLFPRNYDFETVCSCEECIPKIKYLKDFEGFIVSIYKVVLVFLDRREQANDYCDAILYACDWSEKTLDSFLFRLKYVYDELKEEFTEGGRGLKHKIENMKLYKILADSGLYPNYKNVPAAEFVNKKNYRCLAEDIDFNIGSRGMYYYKKTKFREEGEQLLKKILEIEDKYQIAKKSAVDNEITMNPSISKSFILQQIEYLEKLPVKGLRTEAEACVAKTSDIILKRRYMSGAKRTISVMCRDMALIRRAFWRKNKKWRKGKKGVGGHELTGLSTILDLLGEKAKAFKIDWKKNFAQYFPPVTE